MHIIPNLSCDSVAMHSPTMLPKILAWMRPLMTREGVWGVEVSVKAWACLTSLAEALWLGRAIMGKLEARAAPPSPGSCISLGMLAPALQYGCRPVPLDPDPDPDLLLCPGRGLEMLWQKKKTSFLADLKNHLGALQLNLCVQLVDHFYWLGPVPVTLTSL